MLRKNNRETENREFATENGSNPQPSIHVREQCSFDV